MTSDVLDEGLGEASGAMDVSPVTLNGAPARAMVALSPHGQQVAVWLMDFAGVSCGAWLLDADTNEDALRILRLCDRRAVLDGSASSTSLILELAAQAGVEIPEGHVKERLARLEALLSATRAARDAHAEAVIALSKQGGKKLARLSWRNELPESVDAEWARQGRGWAGEGNPPEAFSLTVRASRLLRLWTETEEVRMRRSYLRDEFGPSRAIPDVWREAALSAYANPYRC